MSGVQFSISFIVVTFVNNVCIHLFHIMKLKNNFLRQLAKTIYLVTEAVDIHQICKSFSLFLLITTCILT